MANAKKKGDRNERKAVDILRDAGWTVETPNSTPYPQGYGVDFFGLFDFMAFKDGQILFGQVKSNSPRGIRSFIEECKEMDVPVNADNVTIEYWTHYDNEGFRIDEFDEDGDYTTVLDERESDNNIGVDATEYKS